MTDDDIDDVANSLTSVKAGGSLDSLPIAAVEDGDHEVVVTLELPSGNAFEHAFNRPPVWGANCDLKRLLDHFGLGPDEVDALVGEEVPCEREVGDGGLTFWVDVDALDA